MRIDDLALLPGEAAHPTLGIFTHDDRHPHVVPFIRGLVDEHHVNVSAVLLTTQRVIHHCAVLRCVVLQGAAELRGEGKAKATVGWGRIVTFHHRSSVLYLILTN